VEREVGVGAQASDEVILEGADGAFGRIGVVNTRRDELEVNVLIAEELLDSSRALVVETLELGRRLARTSRLWTVLYAARMAAPDLLGMGSAWMELLS
jgi:hypothetical protein